VHSALLLTVVATPAALVVVVETVLYVKLFEHYEKPVAKVAFVVS